MRTLLCVALSVVMAGPLLAHWKVGDPYKMHYPQLPDEEGWDVNATFPRVLADDWQCTGTGWVEDMHFWGSWRYGQPGTIQSFHLSIRANIPGEQGQPSMPGELLWEREIYDFGIVPIDPTTYQGWYDPETGQYAFNDHSNYFQYNVILPTSMWFWQREGEIYWLDVSARVAETGRFWGWKSSDDHFMDDAVRGRMPTTPWTPMYEPPDFLQTLDLAFVITPEPSAVALLIGGILMALRRR